jgi:hypothetical protein
MNNSGQVVVTNCSMPEDELLFAGKSKTTVADDLEISHNMIDR